MSNLFTEVSFEQQETVAGGGVSHCHKNWWPKHKFHAYPGYNRRPGYGLAGRYAPGYDTNDIDVIFKAPVVGSTINITDVDDYTGAWY